MTILREEHSSVLNMKTDHESDLLESLESGYCLPSLSVIAMKLVEMASDEDCSVDDLVNLIEQDPSLMVRLLRLANSAFFQSGHPATTLRQAIVRIGFDRLRIMGLSLSLRDTFPMGRMGPMDYEKFWRSSLYQALVAKSLAHWVSDCNPEEAFVAGLTVEIGLLIFFDLFMRKDERANGHLDLYPLESLLSWEKERYGVDHRQVGEAVLGYWKFPDRIVACQRFYGMKVRDEGAPALSVVCEVARELSALLCQKPAEIHAPFRMAEELLGLNHEVINGILMTTLQQVETIADSLRVEVSKERDIIWLMEKANRALSRLSQQLSMGQHLPSQRALPSFQSLDQEDERKAVVAHTLEAVAHEIRNPLVAVGGFAKRLASTLDPDSEAGKYVRVILEESERLEQALLEMNGNAAPGV